MPALFTTPHRSANRNILVYIIIAIEKHASIKGLNNSFNNSEYAQKKEHEPYFEVETIQATAMTLTISAD